MIILVFIALVFPLIAAVISVLHLTKLSKQHYETRKKLSIEEIIQARGYRHSAINRIKPIYEFYILEQNIKFP